MVSSTRRAATFKTGCTFSGVSSCLIGRAIGCIKDRSRYCSRLVVELPRTVARCWFGNHVGLIVYRARRRMFLRSLLLPSLLLLSARTFAEIFDIAYSWREVNFDFANTSLRDAYIASGDYVQGNNLPLGLAVWRNKMFVTVPRWKKGVPSNFNYFIMNETVADVSPCLKPYPDLATNDIHADGEIIVNVFRARVDACDRLWAVDTGLEDILGETTVVRPTRIIVIDLNTDKIIRSYTLKDSDQKGESFFADLAVDVESNRCDEAFAYLSDLSGYGMVVYSWAKNDSWRIQHNYFYFDPLNGDYNISGYNFQWTDGLFGLSLSPMMDDGYKTLYFHAMSGITEFSVSTEILRDETAAAGNNYHSFRVVGEKGPLTQGPSSVIDQETGIDYLTQVNRNGLACWDTSVPLNPDTFVLAAQDNVTMVFPNDLVIDPVARKLYVLADNLPRFQRSSLKSSEPNFYINVAKLDDLTAICKSSVV